MATKADSARQKRRDENKKPRKKTPLSSYAESQKLRKLQKRLRKKGLGALYKNEKIEVEVKTFDDFEGE